jgi:tetratricopeptide (TPR) repeat protein
MRIGLVVLYRRLGRHELADMHAKQARDYFRALAQAEVDNLTARRLWAESEVLIGDFPQAVNVLVQGLQLSKAPMFRQSLANVFGLWSDVLADGSTTKFGNRVALIEQGLSYDPANDGLLQRLLALTRPPRAEVISTLGVSLIGFGASSLELAPLVDCPTLIFLQAQNDPRQARAVLQQLLARGEAPATVHLALGLDAWEQGKVTDARRHWEQAYQQDPSMALVGNNLAWVLATQEPTDLPRALQMIDSVLARAPNEPAYHGTRGQILLRMKRWQDALKELVVFLKASPDNPETHAALAEAYAQLGFPEIAAKHKEMAQKKK